MELTSREIASGIIVAGFVLLSLSISKDKQRLGESLSGVVKAFSAWKVWGTLLAYLLYLVGVVIVAHNFGAWSSELLKDTFVVGLFVGLPILFNSTKFKDGPEVVAHVVKEVLGVAALLLVYLNLAIFPLWGELLLQVSLLFCVLLAMVAKLKPETTAVGKFFEGVIGVIVLILVVHVTAQILVHFKEVNWGSETYAFVHSVWLPLSLIPFIYLFGLMAACEVALMRVGLFSRKKAPPLPVKLALLFGMRGSLRYAANFTRNWPFYLAKQRSFRQAFLIMRKYRHAVRRNDRQNRERLRSLRRNKGLVGKDELRLWRDRREFHETKEALGRIEGSQLGMYGHRGGRYSNDPVTIFPFRGFKDLPEEHGIDFRVRGDGQAWIAWRHTVGGFCLGIGGTNDLDVRWRYAGEGAPQNYPSPNSSGWGKISEGSESCPEWQASDGPVLLAQE